MSRVAGAVMVEGVEEWRRQSHRAWGLPGLEEPRPPRPSWRPKSRARSARAPEPDRPALRSGEGRSAAEGGRRRRFCFAMQRPKAGGKSPPQGRCAGAPRRHTSPVRRRPRAAAPPASEVSPSEDEDGPPLAAPPFVRQPGTRRVRRRTGAVPHPAGRAEARDTPPAPRGREPLGRH